jgi:hypothetical protein
VTRRHPSQFSGAMEIFIWHSAQSGVKRTIVPYVAVQRRTLGATART